MRTDFQNAVVVLEDGAEAHHGSRAFPEQAVEIRKTDNDSIIGIDGHTGFWDELVEVRWEGSHQKELENAIRVEIRDTDGTVLESLPVNTSRRSYERDGQTVFFLVDAQ